MIKKATVMGLALLLIFQTFTLSAFAEPEVTEQTEETTQTTVDTQETEENGEQPEEYQAYEIQYILSNYGYYVGQPSGEYDEKTDAAVKAFGVDRGIEEGILQSIHEAGCTSAEVKIRTQLYVRQQPDSESEIVDVVTHSSAIFTYYIRDNWFYVETESGMKGYVPEKYLKNGNVLGIEGVTVDISEGVNIRTEANMNAGIVTKINSGVNLRVVSGNGDWFKVEFDGGKGYIFKKYVSIGSEHGASTILEETFEAWQGSAKTKLNLRNVPEENGEKISAVSSGTSFDVLGKSGNWYYIKLNNGTMGYVNSQYVRKGIAYNTCTVTGVTSSLNIRATASKTAKVVATVENGTVLTLVEDTNDWFKVKTAAGITGYVNSKYLKMGGTLAPVSSTKTTSEKSTKNSGTKTSNEVNKASSVQVNSNAALGEQIAQYAQNYLGCPYSIGATGPNRFDCSGLTYYVYKHFGITLLRTAYEQGYNQKGQKITSRGDLQVGDLVFFNTVPNDSDVCDHAGIYIGGGKFVHASSGSEYKVVISSMSSNYYNGIFAWGRRIV